MQNRATQKWQILLRELAFHATSKTSRGNKRMKFCHELKLRIKPAKRDVEALPLSP